MQQLFEKYEKDGFRILAFPCNQFGAQVRALCNVFCMPEIHGFQLQEPKDLPEIEKFVTSSFGVTFPLMDKIDVNGPSAHPLFKEMLNTSDVIAWNFHKVIRIIDCVSCHPSLLSPPSGPPIKKNLASPIFYSSLLTARAI